MSLSASDVTRIANDAVRATSTELQVVGVTLGGSDSDYVEVLINIHGCHSGPCRIQVGAFRDAGAAALREQITRQLEEHRTRQDPSS